MRSYSDKELEKHLTEIDKEIDSYQDTVWGLLALSHEILFNESSRTSGDDGNCCFGRRMTTSKRNLISPENQVTPDLVVQPTNTYGVTAEVKIGYKPSTLYTLKFRV